MGKIKCILFIVVVLIIASCSKEERFSPGGLYQDEMCKGVGHFESGNVFVVPLPTGDDDTPNFLAAVELAKAAGQGSVVKLQAGTYSLNFIKIYDFIGTIKGAGIGKTIIKSVPGLLCLEETATVGCVTLVTFVGGDITLSDISFKFDDGDPCAADYLTYGKDLYVMVKFTDRLHEAVIPEKHSVNATVRNCSFTPGFNGPDGGGLKYNTCATLWFGFDFLWTGNDERTIGNFNVSDCIFEGGWTAIDLAGMGGGKINVSNNKFIDMYAPLFYYDNINVECTIGNNQFLNSIFYDVYIDDTDLGIYGYYFYEPPVRRSIFRIAGNSFDTYNYGGTFLHPAGVSIYMFDLRLTMHPEENLAMKFFLENNRFTLHEGASAIVGMNGRDAMIIANKFTGNGKAGISVDGTSSDLMASSLKILGNNFLDSDLETDVLLGEFTTNCLVTRNFKDNVVNLGVNNRITGMPK